MRHAGRDMIAAEAEGASVYWTARVQGQGGETRLASCRYAGMDSMAFVGDDVYPVGAEVTMFVASLHASVCAPNGWTAFKLRVAYLSFADGLYRMGCVHQGTPESSMAWLAQALSRLSKPKPWTALVLPLPLAPAEPAAQPSSREAQRHPFQNLLGPGPRATELLAHDGAFDGPALFALFGKARAALAAAGLTRLQRRRAYTGVVELARNVQMHALRSASETPQGALRVRMRADAAGGEAPLCIVSVANRITAGAAERLASLMQALQAMDAACAQAALRRVMSAPAADGAAQTSPGFGLLTLSALGRRPLECIFPTVTRGGQPVRCVVFTLHL
jgi:hypothetical protein